MTNRISKGTIMIFLSISLAVSGCLPGRQVQMPGRGQAISDLNAFLAQSKWDSTGTIEFPDSSGIVLPNGLRVIVVEMPGIPMVYARSQIRGGSIYDPRDKSGLAYLTGWVLTQGTESWTNEMIDTVMDSHGAWVTSEAFNESCIVTMTCLSKDIELLFPYFAEIISKPSFDARVIEESRRYLTGDLMRNMDDAGEVCDRVFRNEIFRGHPYQKQMNGTVEGFQAVTVDDVRDFYRDYYCPDRAALVVVGDVKTDAVIKLSETYLGKWRTSVAPLPIVNAPDPIRGLRVLLVDRPADTQAHVRLGHTGINRTNPDRFKITVMNKILGGGGLYTRLAEEVRVKRGLTYSIYSFFARREYTGEFVVSTFTRTDQAVETIQVILNEIRRIQNEPVSEQELDDAKRALTGSHPLRFEEYEDIAQTLVHNSFYGLPITDVTHFAQAVNKVTIEDVQQAARKYLYPDDIVIVVTGSADQLQSALEEIGPVVLVNPV